MLVDSMAGTRTVGGGSSAATSKFVSKTIGVTTTIWKQQQRQASPGSGLRSSGTPEISQLAGENTSHAINSTPVSRRIPIATIGKIVAREGMSSLDFLTVQLRNTVSNWPAPLAATGAAGGRSAVRG